MTLGEVLVFQLAFVLLEFILAIKSKITLTHFYIPVITRLDRAIQSYPDFLRML